LLTAQSSGYNQLYLKTDGNVGIGTTNPGWKLDVAAGYINSVSGYKTNGADYAEYFETKDTDLASGEVVCIDTLNKNSVSRCKNASDINVMGIVSTNPAFLGNSSKEKEGSPKYKAIAMLGQIPAKVSNENGAIQIGDSLTSSSTPGHVMRANAGDSTVGVALESFGDGSFADAQDDRTGIIQVMISRRNKSLTVEAVEEKVAERVAAMKIEDEVNRLVASAVAQLTPQNSLTLDENGNVVLSSDTTSKVDLFTSISSSDSFKSYMNTVDQPDIRIDQLDERLQSVEDRLNTLEQASASASLDTLTDRVGFLEQMFGEETATSSASIARSITDTEVIFEKKLIAEDDLTVLGKTVLSDLGITGDITAGLLVFKSEDASINALGSTLKLQSELGAGDIEAFGGKIVMTADGSIVLENTVKADKIVARTFTVLGADTVALESTSSATLADPAVQKQSTVGTATIESGQTEIVIENINIDANSKIFITPTTSTEGQTLILIEKSVGSAKITIDTAVTSDITFDYWIVGVE
ncbi:hypothetical protein KBD81_01440, partial [Candidatus Woesebacteria bacterium]|nr:hypothetical protein [Candidatus Woesebacteria bacterium]